MDRLKKCTLCPRNCNVDRTSSSLGFCNATDKVKIARASLHFWEEPCISGTKGSGTVFFSNCNLKCVFCQNHKISHGGFGKEISIEKLSSIFLNLQDRGAHNINLVTPTHYAFQIIKALDLAKKNGLSIPILYNSNGYEKESTIESLKGYIDVYLPDFKYFNDKYAIKYSNCKNYFKYASSSIEKMYMQVGAPSFDSKGLIKKGVIIRHLMLPGLLFDSKKIVDYIYSKFKDNVYLSIMNQYTPIDSLTNKYPEINKTLNPKHYKSFINYCAELGIKNAFIQDSESSSEKFIPDFDLRGI